MIHDEEIKKVVKECVDDPEHGKMFKNLFSEVTKLHDKQKKEKTEDPEPCYKCEEWKKDLVSFFMIDDWSQFEIKICQECILLLAHQNFEAAEEWLCPICKKQYACTICGKDHPTGFCSVFQDNPVYFIGRKSAGKTATMVQFAYLQNKITLMQNFLMSIRKKTKDEEISQMIKIFFNSEYGASAEPISANFSFKDSIYADTDFMVTTPFDTVIDYSKPEDSFEESTIVNLKMNLIEADRKHSVYVDTDSYMLKPISEEDLITIINQLDKRKLIIITGRRGSGKTGAAIRLYEQISKTDLSIENCLIYSDYTLIKTDNRDLVVFPSFESIPIKEFKRVGMLIRIFYNDKVNGLVRANVYVYNKNQHIVKIDKAFSVAIPFCSKKSYNLYRDILYAFVNNEMENTRHGF